MHNIKKCLQIAVAFLFWLTVATSAWAAAYDLPDQDAFVIGRGMAFAATADNPSAIYYNPAGITQLEGNNLRAGIYGIDLQPQFQPPGTAPNAGQTYDNQLKYHAIPQLYYVYTPTNWKASFGLGVYSPFGLGVIWPQDTGFRTLGIEGKLFTETINPVVAFKVLPSLSIAGGVMVNYADLKLTQGLGSFPSTASFEFDGHGWNVGYNLGVRWQPMDQLAFGGTFHSGYTINYDGHTEITGVGSSSAESKWKFPLKTIVGVSYRPTPKWNLEFNADYTDWNALQTVNITQTSFPGLNIPVTLGWMSSWYYEFGATRYLDNGWHVSGGYIYNENSVPDAHYSPLVADLNRHFFSLGVGRTGKNIDFDVAYQFGYGPPHTVTGSAASPFGETADGKYSFLSHAIAVSVGWHF
jgi:long-chain fatty acid transport protein